MRANRQRSLSSYRGHPVPTVGRSLTRLAIPHRLPALRCGAVPTVGRGKGRRALRRPPVGASLVGARWAGWGASVHQPRPTAWRTRPFLDRLAKPRSGTHTLTRLPRLRSGTPSATARLDVTTFTPRSPPPTGAHKRRPYMVPAGAGPGNRALPHIPPLLLGEGWGEGQSTTLSIVVPGAPGTHGGAGYSADAAALWPPVGASLVGARWGGAGLGTTFGYRRARSQDIPPAITPPRIPGFPGKTRLGRYRVSPVRRGKATDLPDSIRYPHPHSSSPTPIGDPFGYRPAPRNHVPHVHPNGRPQETPLHGPSRGWAGEPRASPHTPSPLGRGLG